MKDLYITVNIGQWLTSGLVLFLVIMIMKEIPEVKTFDATIYYIGKCGWFNYFHFYHNHDS